MGGVTVKGRRPGIKAQRAPTKQKIKGLVFFADNKTFAYFASLR
jgi:hypothetical protein